MRALVSCRMNDARKKERKKIDKPLSKEGDGTCLTGNVSALFVTGPTFSGSMLWLLLQDFFVGMKTFCEPRVLVANHFFVGMVLYHTIPYYTQVMR